LNTYQQPSEIDNSTQRLQTSIPKGFVGMPQDW